VETPRTTDRNAARDRFPSVSAKIAAMRSAALLFLMATSCAKPAPEATPEEVTATYFTALGSGDCAGITAASGGNLANEIADAGCAGSVAEAKEHGLVFVGSENVRADGRDPNARLVDVKLRADGKEKRVIARVQRVRNSWKLVAL
jgi:hypothetical protein